MQEPNLQEFRMALAVADTGTTSTKVASAIAPTITTTFTEASTSSGRPNHPGDAELSRRSPSSAATTITHCGSGTASDCARRAMAENSAIATKTRLTQ